MRAKLMVKFTDSSLLLFKSAKLTLEAIKFFDGNKSFLNQNQDYTFEFIQPFYSLMLIF